MILLNLVILLVPLAAEPRSGEAQNETENLNYSSVLRGWDTVRTWFWEQFPMVEPIKIPV